MKIYLKLSAFDQLSTQELYAILQLRQLVFVVEQKCAYQDCDGKDRTALHLTGWTTAGEPAELAAYLRIILPETCSGKPKSPGRQVFIK